MFRIARIDAFAIAVPLKTPIRMSMQTVTTCDNLVVRVSDGTGRAGWGEAPAAPTISGETTRGMIAAVEYMAPKLEGREIAAPDDLPGLIDP